jgi:hypothetical protein
MQVHEDNNTVTVQAGVTQRILLDYLAAYMCADLCLRMVHCTNHAYISRISDKMVLAL